MFKTFLSNHVLANLTFLLVLFLGYLAFSEMPRAREPDLVLNFVSIVTSLPGASASEVEKRITNPIEERISSTIKDIQFIQSSSRSNVSFITLRFEDIASELFRDHLQKLRREVQNVYSEQLPDTATDPQINSLSSASFPSAFVVAKAERYDDAFRRYLSDSKKVIERLQGVDDAEVTGISDPELHIAFYPDRLVGLGLTPADLSDTMASYFRDLSIGDVDQDQRKLVIRLSGTSGSLDDVRKFPIISSKGVVELGDLADVYYTSAKRSTWVQHRTEPAALFTISRQIGGNELEILQQLRQFIATENQRQKSKGIEWVLIDDQTVTTRDAISMMQSNAMIGLALVVLVSYLFLGGRIAFLTTIGIPFTLCGTFIVLAAMGKSVNNTSLLGVVVALGMIVDDAVVVVEAIYYRLQRGVKIFDASVGALKEVAAPVITSIFTTIAVFLPLIFLPGILGSFISELPVVVCIALLISLIEAFWILPAHVSFVNVKVSSQNRIQQLRTSLTRKVRNRYTRLLIWTFRKPLLAISVTLLPPLLAVYLLLGGAVKLNFFPEDPTRVFYVNLEMPSDTTLDRTIEVASKVEGLVIPSLRDGELDESVTYAGVFFTLPAPGFGDNLAQIYFTFKPHKRGMRPIEDILDGIRQTIGERFGDAKVSYTEVLTGPPLGAPVSIKFLGPNYNDLHLAVEEIKAKLAERPEFVNVTDSYNEGAPTMLVKLDGDAVKRSGLHPSVITRSLSGFVDGELIAQFQRDGEEVDIRLLAKPDSFSSDQLLQQTIANPQGEEVMLGSLFEINYQVEPLDAKHFNYLRSIELSSFLDLEAIDVVSANNLLREFWEEIRYKYPEISIDTTGVFDDLTATIDSMLFFFVMGMGLIYLILGTQFKSYFQPLIVLLSVPLAFTGVIYGIAVTQSPMTFYTMYGVVALSGIAVNSAIVLLSAANQRIATGMGVLAATLYASRRRVIPVLITTFTTIGGLFSMAVGLAGDSIVWGPLAVAIVSGLFFSTPLILLVIPHVYRLFMVSPLAKI